MFYIIAVLRDGEMSNTNIRGYDWGDSEGPAITTDKIIMAMPKIVCA